MPRSKPPCSLHTPSGSLAITYIVIFGFSLFTLKAACSIRSFYTAWVAPTSASLPTSSATPTIGLSANYGNLANISQSLYAYGPTSTEAVSMPSWPLVWICAALVVIGIVSPFMRLMFASSGSSIGYGNGNCRPRRLSYSPSVNLLVPSYARVEVRQTMWCMPLGRALRAIIYALALRHCLPTMIAFVAASSTRMTWVSNITALSIGLLTAFAAVARKGLLNTLFENSNTSPSSQYEPVDIGTPETVLLNLDIITVSEAEADGIVPPDADEAELEAPAHAVVPPTTFTPEFEVSTILSLIDKLADTEPSLSLQLLLGSDNGDEDGEDKVNISAEAFFELASIDAEYEGLSTFTAFLQLAAIELIAYLSHNVFVELAAIELIAYTSQDTFIELASIELVPYASHNAFLEFTSIDLSYELPPKVSATPLSIIVGQETKEADILEETDTSFIPIPPSNSLQGCMDPEPKPLPCFDVSESEYDDETEANNGDIEDSDFAEFEGSDTETEDGEVVDVTEDEVEYYGAEAVEDVVDDEVDYSMDADVEDEIESEIDTEARDDDRAMDIDEYLPSSPFIDTTLEIQGEYPWSPQPGSLSAQIEDGDNYPLGLGPKDITLLQRMHAMNEELLNMSAIGMPPASAEDSVVLSEMSMFDPESSFHLSELNFSPPVHSPVDQSEPINQVSGYLWYEGDSTQEEQWDLAGIESATFNTSPVDDFEFSAVGDFDAANVTSDPFLNSECCIPSRHRRNAILFDAPSSPLSEALDTEGSNTSIVEERSFLARMFAADTTADHSGRASGSTFGAPTLAQEMQSGRGKAVPVRPPRPSMDLGLDEDEFDQAYDRTLEMSSMFGAGLGQLTSLPQDQGEEDEEGEWNLSASLMGKGKGRADPVTPRGPSLALDLTTPTETPRRRAPGLIPSLLMSPAPRIIITPPALPRRSLIVPPRLHPAPLSPRVATASTTRSLLPVAKRNAFQRSSILGLTAPLSVKGKKGSWR